jgi:hypothetical protein
VAELKTEKIDLSVVRDPSEYVVRTQPARVISVFVSEKDKPPASSCGQPSFDGHGK